MTKSAVTFRENSNTKVIFFEFINVLLGRDGERWLSRHWALELGMGNGLVSY